MKKILLSFLLILNFIFCQTVNAQPELIAVNASVPLTKTWQEAITSNSRIQINQDGGNNQILITILGVQSVPVYNHLIVLELKNENRLLYISKLQTNQAGKVAFNLPNLSDGRYQMEVDDIYGGLNLRLNFQKNIDLSIDTKKAASQIFKNYLNWTELMTLSNKVLISSISIPVRAKL